MNPPCYGCESPTPLLAGQMGLCPACAAKIEERATRKSAQTTCTRCGHGFYNDWERIQHGVNQRHNYLAWTAEDGRRFAEKDARRSV